MLENSKGGFTWVMRSVVEFRFKNRIFSFMDNRGRLLDEIISRSGFSFVSNLESLHKFQVNSAKADAAVFLSFENFGIQLEGITGFNAMSDRVVELIDFVLSEDIFQNKLLQRVGLKTTILCTDRTKKLKQLQNRHNTIYYGNLSLLEKTLGASISDSAFVVTDIQKGDKKLNISTGITTKEEAISKYFGEKELYIDQYKKESGLLIDADVYTQMELLPTKESLSQTFLALRDTTQETITSYIHHFFETDES